jgi:hypothetical protein
MSNRSFSNAEALNQGVKIIAGTIKCGIHGDLSDATLTGLGFRVSKHVTDGVISVHLDPGLYESLLGATYTPGPGLAQASSASIYTNAVDADNRVDLLLMQEDADPAASWVPHNLTNGEQVMFILILRTASSDVR